MRILVDIGHPGHVHFYKHAICKWREMGHNVLLTARDKDVTLALLHYYNMDHAVLSRVERGKLGLLKEFTQRELRLWNVIRHFKPDVVTAVGGLFIAPVCKVMGVPSVVFTDTEHVALDRYLTFPWATIVCTPHCFRGRAGPRHQRYKGFQELAYLHPAYFRPNPAVLDELELKPSERFALLRFVAWSATHDVGHSGFSGAQKLQLVEELSKHGRVLVSIEGDLPETLRPFAIKVGPQQIHNLLHYASLYVGEGATMATEAALLGTPSIYVSTLVGTMGNFDELLERYEIVYSYYDPELALEKALSLLENDSKVEWEERRKKLLTEAVDVTQHVFETVTGASHK